MAVIFRFDDFEVDGRAGELRKAGQRVKLQEQPWQVLFALADRAGELVTRDELRQRLWSANTFVDFDHSLNIAINKIRDVLHDSATSPRFIETIPRRGYRFLAAVERVSMPPPPETRGSVEEARTSWVTLIGIGAAAALVIVAVVAVRRPLTSSQRSGHAIAVLPLRNVSLDPDSDYFSDGLSDELIYNLSIIEGLDVKSRASSFAFKGKAIRSREIGRQLQADLLLEGTVVRSAGQLRLNVALVRADDDVTVWSQTYSRSAHDVLGVQREIARAIANELRLKGIGGQRRYSIKADTYDLYLRALSLSHEYAPEFEPQLIRAATMFEEVTVEDDQFAPAWAALAEVYAHLSPRGPIHDSFPRMREAAERALALDPLLPQAQAMVGLVRARELRWQEAESAFRRALDLDGNLAGARGDFAMLVLEPEGKLTEALSQVERAIALDPLSASYRLQLAFALMRAGEHDEALGIANRVLIANPSDEYAPQVSARALMSAGKADQALRILEKLGPPSHGYLGYAYAMVGRRHEAEVLASEADPAAARHRVLIYLALGDRDRCFKALDELAQANDVMADLYPGEPELAPLRDDRRMKAFRQARNLPPN